MAHYQTGRLDATHLNAQADFFGMIDNCFNQALRIHVGVSQEHNFIGICDVTYMGVRTNMNPPVALQGLIKNPVDNVI